MICSLGPPDPHSQSKSSSHISVQLKLERVIHLHVHLLKKAPGTLVALESGCCELRIPPDLDQEIFCQQYSVTIKVCTKMSAGSVLLFYYCNSITLSPPPCSPSSARSWRPGNPEPSKEQEPGQQQHCHFYHSKAAGAQAQAQVGC